MKTILIATTLMALAGCGSAIGQGMPISAPCKYTEPLAPYCLDIAGEEVRLACYGADARETDGGSIVCVWRCVKFEDIYQDVYAVFNPEPSLHLDTMVTTGPAGQCN